MTLAEIRKEIDSTDALIRELIAKRMQLSDEVAKVKAQTGDPVYKPDREAEILNRDPGETVRQWELPYRAVQRKILEVSRMHQYGRILSLTGRQPLGWSEEPAPERGALHCGSASAFEKAALAAAKDGLYIQEILPEEGGSFRLVLSDIPVVKKEHTGSALLLGAESASDVLGKLLSVTQDYGVRIRDLYVLRGGTADQRAGAVVLIDGTLRESLLQAMLWQLQCELPEARFLGSFASAPIFVETP